MAENKLHYLPIQEEKLHSTGRGKNVKIIFPYAKKYIKTSLLLRLEMIIV